MLTKILFTSVKDVSGATLAVHDEFTDTNNTLLDSHTPTDEGTGWTEEYSSATNRRLHISSNEVERNGAVAGNSMRTYYSAQPNPSGADQEVSLVATNHTFANDDPSALLVRASAGDVTSSGSAYVAMIYNDRTDLYKIVSGTATELDSYTTAATEGSTVVKLRASGSTISVLYDDSTVISVSDSAVTQTGRWGVGMGNLCSSGDDINIQRFDSFKAYDL